MQQHPGIHCAAAQTRRLLCLRAPARRLHPRALLILILTPIPILIPIPTLAASALAARAQSPASSSVPAGLAQYEGEYRNLSNSDHASSIYVDRGTLYSESGDGPQGLTPDGQDRFRFASRTYLLFYRDPSGAVIGLKVVSERGGAVLDGSAVLDGGAVLDDETRISELLTHRTGPPREYTRQEAMIPMRDGVRLHAVVLRPAHTAPGETLPILLDRTPYGVSKVGAGDIADQMPELAASGYLFVFEDVRGRYGSGGTFVMNRPILTQDARAHATPRDIDETTDAYDTVGWLVKNLPGNSGRVGVYGISYDGFLAAMAGIDAHPAVKAISPQAPMTDVWLGDDFFHNGAFRESYGFDYVQQMEAQKTDVRVDARQDTYDFFLDHVNFAGAAAAAKIGDLPTARAFLSQPQYTKFWQEMAVQPHQTRVVVPTLLVGGYWDEE
ncbi:MAG TPA: CocE/NonD family hydrolase, partial [Terracidiphilus sp.]